MTETEYQTITQHIKEVVQEVVESNLDANRMVEAFGHSGLILHPVQVHNILQRRWAAQAQSAAPAKG